MIPTEKPWKGEITCYGCPDCDFDALELAEVREHWDRNHGPVARVSPVLGPNGEPIVVEEERTRDWRTSRMIEMQLKEAERLAAAEELADRREAEAIEAIRLEAEEVEAVMTPDPPASITATEPKKKASKKRTRKP